MDINKHILFVFPIWVRLGQSGQMNGRDSTADSSGQMGIIEWDSNMTTLPTMREWTDMFRFAGGEKIATLNFEWINWITCKEN